MNLVNIRYVDHVLFRNSDSNQYYPCIRECVGWLAREDKKAICILFDRSAEDFPNKKIEIKESGLILLKDDILEIREIE